MRVCVCVLNADHIDCNVELIKMGDILISAGNKVFWVIFMGKMVTNLCTPSLSELLLRVSKVHGSNCSLVRRERDPWPSTEITPHPKITADHSKPGYIGEILVYTCPDLLAFLTHLLLATINGILGLMANCIAALLMLPAHPRRGEEV